MTLSSPESKFKGYLGAGIGYKLTKEVSLNAAIDFTQGEFIGEKIRTTLYTIGVNYNF